MRLFLIRLRKILLYDNLYLLLVIISIIFISIYIFNYDYKPKYNITDNKFNLRIKDYKIDGNKININFYEEIVGIYYFENEIEKEKFDYGNNDYVYVEGILNYPNNNTIPNTFNYKEYLNHNKKYYILNIKYIKLISRNKNVFYIIKNYIINRINNIKNNEYLYAFILGKSDYIESNIYNNYKINGITHLFALSGLHVSVFSSFLLIILKKIRLNENISYLLVDAFLIFFSFIASFSPSILRATIFFILSSFNKIFYFYIKPKNILYLVFSFMVIINPFYIFNTGFLLSFCITYFILLYNENNNNDSSFKNIMYVSVLSMISSFPIIINMSYEINIIGFINNLFFIPYVSYIIFPLTLLTFIFNKISFILNVFVFIMEKISYFSSLILNINLIFKKINYIEIFIYYLILILLIKKRKKYLYFMLIIYIFFLYSIPIINNNDGLYFLDVGQGDSTLLTINNKAILIDTGGKISYEESWSKENNNYSIAITKVIPFLKSMGIKKLNYLIITHGDFDHIGEAINLVKNYKVEKVIFNCGEFNDLEKDLIKVLDKKHIKYYSCIKELNIDNNKLYFLQTKEYDNENDNSNVVYTEIDGYKFMFMGDAGVKKEKDILEEYNISNVDVLKVGHHGSKTSSSKEFVNEMNPNYSIISVGKNNRYGHPNKEVLNNLDNSKIYRTDEDGSIMFKIKNNKLKIETCTP